MADRVVREGDVVEWPDSRNRYLVARIYSDGGLVLERLTGAAEEVVLVSDPSRLVGAAFP